MSMHGGSKDISTADLNMGAKIVMMIKFAGDVQNIKKVGPPR
jgi:hypothetical protein